MNEVAGNDPSWSFCYLGNAVAPKSECVCVCVCIWVCSVSYLQQTARQSNGA